jgi:long-chain acyl-CoA synthetase
MTNGIKIVNENGKRIVKGLGCYQPRPVYDLKEMIKGSVERYGDAIGFRFKDKERRITGKTYAEFGNDIDCLGTALLSLGLKGSRIAIISENRYEWGVCYYSIINGTGIAVPMDKYLPKNEVENLIVRGNADAIFYSPAYHDMMLDISQHNERIKYYICIEETNTKGDKRFLVLPELVKKGKGLIDKGDTSFTGTSIDRNAMSVLLFTSGTTSMAKGVMLSHANIAANITSVTTEIYAGPGDVHLSLLPLHHTFENTLGLSFMVHSGVCIAYCDGIKHIAQNLNEYGVSLLVAVPAILEAMYKKMNDGIEKSGKAKAFRLLVKFSDILRAIGIDLRRKLFKSIFNQLGPKLRIVVSGAAPLDPEVITGFDKIGLRLLQGYGLTETSPVVAANNDFVNKPGTIGHPLSNIEVTIDNPDENGLGELLTRGPNVMLGYYEDPGTTSEAIDENGWFHTGDLGFIDDEGFITIAGRAKSMIVFTNGKKAFPEEYELLLNDIPYVKDSFAWGNKAIDGDIQVCAKLVVDREKLISEKGALPADEELSRLFGNAIKSINQTIPQYKIIRYFVMSTEDLIKTTTLKIKRPLEYEKIKIAVDKAGIDMRKASGKFIEKL